MDTISEGRFADINALFERPKDIKPNFQFKEKDAENNSNSEENLLSLLNLSNQIP